MIKMISKTEFQTPNDIFPGVAHGAGCTNDAECTEANNVCTTGSCACSDASFQEDSTTTCTTSKSCILLYVRGFLSNIQCL